MSDSTESSEATLGVSGAAEQGTAIRSAFLKATVYGAASRWEGVPSSSVMSIDDEKLFTDAGAIPPPYSPAHLAMLVEHSDALRQCVDAYCVNVEAFGHRFEPVIDLDADDAREKLAAAMFVENGNKDPTPEEVNARFEEVKKEMRIEKIRLTSFFESCSLEVSFPELRQQTRFDTEVQGSGYWEVLRNRKGEVARFNYVPGHTVRLLPLGPEMVTVEEVVRSSPFSFQRIPVTRRFRRYVQIYDQRKTFFKEFGDPRILSMKHGLFFNSLEELKENDETDEPSREIFHFKIHSPRSAYGVPRWMGALLAVLGSRMAEEVNYLYFDNKSVPPMAILVAGARLSDETAKRLESFIDTEIKGKGNFHKVMVIDAAATDDGSINSGRARIDIKPLTGAQHNDALFQEYDARNIEKVGSAFRLPRILRGDSRETNRATAEASLAFAELQVFSPLRESFDFWMNRQVLSRMEIRYWRFRSNAPSLRDPAALANVLRDLVNAGVIVPGEAREIAEGIFNREFRVLPDDWTKIPLALTLAGGMPGETAGGGGEAGANLPGAGRSGAPDEKRPPASQNSGQELPQRGAAWLKSIRAAFRRGDVEAVADSLIEVRNSLRVREALEAHAEFAALTTKKD